MVSAVISICFQTWQTVVTYYTCSICSWNHGGQRWSWKHWRPKWADIRPVSMHITVSVTQSERNQKYGRIPTVVGSVRHCGPLFATYHKRLSCLAASVLLAVAWSSSTVWHGVPAESSCNCFLVLIIIIIIITRKFITWAYEDCSEWEPLNRCSCYAFVKLFLMRVYTCAVCKMNTLYAGMGENNCAWNRQLTIHRETLAAAAAIYKGTSNNSFPFFKWFCLIFISAMKMFPS